MSDVGLTPVPPAIVKGRASIKPSYAGAPNGSPAEISVAFIWTLIPRLYLARRNSVIRREEGADALAGRCESRAGSSCSSSGTRRRHARGSTSSSSIATGARTVLRLRPPSEQALDAFYHPNAVPQAACPLDAYSRPDLGAPATRPRAPRAGRAPGSRRRSCAAGRPSSRPRRRPRTPPHRSRPRDRGRRRRRRGRRA